MSDSFNSDSKRLVSWSCRPWDDGHPCKGRRGAIHGWSGPQQLTKARNPSYPPPQLRMWIPRLQKYLGPALRYNSACGLAKVTFGRSLKPARPAYAFRACRFGGQWSLSFLRCLHTHGFVLALVRFCPSYVPVVFSVPA